MAKTSLARLASGLRRGGFPWLSNVVRTELRNPQFAVTRQLRRAAAAVDRRTRGAFGGGSAIARQHRRSLLFFLDLEAVPLTFDVATYLAGAELARRAAKLDSIFVVVVPGRHHGVRAEDDDYEQVVDVTERQWRLRHVVIPCLSLLPSVSGHVLCADRGEAAAWLAEGAAIYPDGYLSGLPNQPALRLVRDAAAAGTPIWPLLEAEPAALRHAGRYLDHVASGRRPITIGLRSYGYSTGRNSDLPAWLDFADGAREAGYAPIFVPDMAASLTGGVPEFRNHLVCAAAAWNIGLRMGLYESAHLNLGLMHGPMELCWYNRTARYLIFVPVGTAPQTDPEFLTRQGFRIGEDFAFATPGQHLVWEQDRRETIEREFARMTERLQAEPPRHASSAST